MENKLFIDLKNNGVGGVCKAKDFKAQIDKLRNDLQGAAL